MFLSFQSGLIESLNSMNAALHDCQDFSEYMKQFVSLYCDVVSHASDMEKTVQEKQELLHTVCHKMRQCMLALRDHNLVIKNDMEEIPVRSLEMMTSVLDTWNRASRQMEDRCKLAVNEMWRSNCMLDEKVKLMEMESASRITQTEEIQKQLKEMEEERTSLREEMDGWKDKYHLACDEGKKYRQLHEESLQKMEQLKAQSKKDFQKYETNLKSIQEQIHTGIQKIKEERQSLSVSVEDMKEIFSGKISRMEGPMELLAVKIQQANEIIHSLQTRSREQKDTIGIMTNGHTQTLNVIQRLKQHNDVLKKRLTKRNPLS